MTQKELEEIKKLIEQGFFTAFRTGVWEDSNGKIHNVTQGDLETIIHNFEKSQKNGKEVTLSIEHSEDEESQKGIIEKVIRFGDYLFAKAKDIKSDFVQKLKKGFYKFVSVALDDKYGLLHIGCTNQPAVQGLFPITKAFSKFSKDSIVFEFEMSSPDKQKAKDLQGLNNVQRCFQCILGDDETNKDNQFAQNINQSNKEVIMPDDEKEKNVNPGKDENQNYDVAAFKKKLDDSEKRADEAEQRANAAEEKVADIEEQNRKNQIATFTKNLMEIKKLYPNEVESMNEFLYRQDDQETYLFSKDAEKQTQMQFIKEFLENLPDRLPLDKIQGPKTKTGQDNACFSRIKPDDENLDLHYRAKALAGSEKIPYEEALARLED